MVQAPPPGVLFPQRLGKGVQLEHHAPSAALAPWVVRFWIARWQLDAPAKQPLIPHPCVNVQIVHAEGAPSFAEICGVKSKHTEQALRGRGLIFGVKFTPGGFHPLASGSVARLTDRCVPLATLLGDDAPWRALVELADTPAMIRGAEALLRARLPVRPDAALVEVTRLHRRIAEDRRIVRVAELCAQTGVPMRRVQQLFREHVGVGPKWVISRYRLHEAAARLEADAEVDLGRLAMELGYFDQSHFTRELEQLIGMSPRAYARASRSAAPL